MSEISSNNVQVNYKVNIQKDGYTKNGRGLYAVTNNLTNDVTKISVKAEDCDKFEQSVNAINSYSEKISNPKTIRNNKIKSYASFLTLGLAGIIAPTVLTRNSKLWVKIASNIGGVLLGAATGMMAFLGFSIPKGSKAAQKAGETLQKLDIRQER